MSGLPSSVREFMCITTLGSDQEQVANDACWADLVDEADASNVVYMGNVTACLLNLPEELLLDLLRQMEEKFADNHINCDVKYNAFESKSYAFGMALLALLFLSMTCLLLTVVAYALKKELLTLPGLNLACLCTSHFVHYLTGVLNLFNVPHYQASEQACVFFGFTRNFTILATFFWLNVMAFDIWRTIYKMEPSSPSQRRRVKWSRFLKYSLYAWGMALVIAVTAVIFNSIPSIPEAFRPSFSRPYLKDPDIRCTMSGNHLGSLFLFNIAPRLLVLVANIVFFVLTTRVIYKTGKQTDHVRSTSQHKDRYRLYLKLFVVMGLAWTLNIIEYTVQLGYDVDWSHSGPRGFRIAVDYVTAFIGVAIYLTFGLMPTVVFIRETLRRMRGRGRACSSVTDAESVRSSITCISAAPRQNKPAATKTHPNELELTSQANKTRY